MNRTPNRQEWICCKRTIRRLTAAVVLLSLLCTTFFVLWLTKGSEHTSDNSSKDAPISSITPSSVASVSSMSEEEKVIAALADELDDWNLALVNRQNALPNNYSVKTAKIAASYARDFGMVYDARAVSKLNEMCAAAEADGVSLLVISSFRTRQKQTSLYNNQINKMKARYPHLTDAEAREKAATVSAIPGTSEHELGLAVDFNSVEETFADTEAFRWLKAHAAEYGFIMRYAKEKEAITGIIYEPWHYRYVGEKHAKKMVEMDFCLEEYVDYLKNNTK